MPLWLKIVLLVVALPISLRPLLPDVAPWLGTSVEFQSSDAGWHDGEVLSKGRDFADVSALFEGYKRRCERPDANLERTVEKPTPLALSWWFDNYDDPKWRVPFAESRAIRLSLEDIRDCRGARGSAA
ncbi:MAG: hypothetical protein NXI30_03755 [bacterium]|nr:hypothetical protein [bacterium]